MLIKHVRSWTWTNWNFCLWKIFKMERSQVLGNNCLCLLMIRVIGQWFRCLGTMCTTNCYDLLTPYLCSPWLTRSMNVMELKNIVMFLCGWAVVVVLFECLGRDPTCVARDWLIAWRVLELKHVVMFLCGWAVVVVLLSFNIFYLCLWVRARAVQAPLVFVFSLPCIVGQTLVWSGSGLSLSLF